MRRCDRLLSMKLSPNARKISATSRVGKFIWMPAPDASGYGWKSVERIRRLRSCRWTSEIDHGVPRIAVSQQDLNGRQFGAAVHQMGSEAVRLCRMRHRRHYAASRTMPRGSERTGPRPRIKGCCAPAFNMRHSPELGIRLFEEGQQLVVRLKTLWNALHWISLGQGCSFNARSASR